MDDPDVFAYIYPARGEGHAAAVATIAKYKNSPMYISPLFEPTRPSSAQPGRGSRATTEDPSDDGDDADEDGPCKQYGGLAIRFSVGARSRAGVVFGTGGGSDIVISNVTGVSQYHIAITFDTKNRLVVRDLGSKFGTRVTYGDGTNTARKRDFSWLLDGPAILGPSRTTFVCMVTKLQFEVVVPQHNTKSSLYLEKIERFRHGTLDVDELAAAITLQRSGRTTADPSATQSPFSSQDANVTRHLGQGSFAAVTFVWNASTGEERAIKEPLEKHVISNAVNAQKWMEEARILRRISHEHVVKVFEVESSPYPRLSLEYMPGGSLDACRDLTTVENTQILCQLSSALEYIHNLDPPIAHRDIKPANILVESRLPSNDGIRVKFGDFGLAREASFLSTICGSLKYEAPEIFNLRVGANVRNSPPFHKYDAAVDIYSLGVTVGSLEYRLPPYKDTYTYDGLAWAKVMRDHFEDLAFVNELMDFLSQNMVVIDTQARKNAAECHANALLLLADLKSGATTPRASADRSQAGTVSSKDRKSARQTALEFTKVQYPATAIYHGLSLGGGGAVSRGNQITRSGAPLPDLPGAVRAPVASSPRHEEAGDGDACLPVQHPEGMRLRSGRVTKSGPLSPHPVPQQPKGRRM